MNPIASLYIRELKRLTKDCRTVLDIGCGACSPVRFLSAETTGVDGYEPALREARNGETHDHYEMADVRNLGERYGENSFDAVTALDLIEHLPKEDGWRLLETVEKIAVRRVILFTPNGFLPQGNKEDGDLQVHVSGWTPRDFAARGYTVYGMHGPKGIRGESARLLRRPRWVWGAVSLCGQVLYCRTHPERAAALLAAKDMTENNGRRGKA